jgi:hypothetical protein
VKEDDGIARTLVHIVHAQSVDVGVMRLVVEAREPLEAIVWCAEDLQATARYRNNERRP